MPQQACKWKKGNLPQSPLQTLDTQRPFNYGRTLMACDTMMTSVKSEIVLSSIINILARRVSGKASVGLNAVAVLYPRKR
jgi:hypothetical protein